jgi:hypothetical protein
MLQPIVDGLLEREAAITEFCKGEVVKLFQPIDIDLGELFQLLTIVVTIAISSPSKSTVALTLTQTCGCATELAAPKTRPAARENADSMTRGAYTLEIPLDNLAGAYANYINALVHRLPESHVK